jgi:molybdopterin-guanine dinucleotide biosynthesis adapter protein
MKAVLIRHKEDLCLVNNLSNIQAVLTWIPIDETGDYPIFSIINTDQFIKWLFNKFLPKRLNRIFFWKVEKYRTPII